MRKNKDLFSIFPADAGVNLEFQMDLINQIDIPRGCGGEPEIQELKNARQEYSPRMRG